jgi:hypothetical protein
VYVRQILGLPHQEADDPGDSTEKHADQAILPEPPDESVISKRHNIISRERSIILIAVDRTHVFNARIYNELQN